MSRSALSGLSAVKLALLARDARDASQAALNADPIAIVGMACRTPGGADTPHEFWRLLKAGVDATGDVPPDRWDADAWFDPDPSAPGKSVTRRGGFLRNVDEFDAEFFGILEREADAMDPQQRLVLEVAIEAIDDAGIPHASLKLARAGVLIATYQHDYARLAYSDIDSIGLRTLTGTAQCVVANRISHFLDLRGPSMTIDSACSASLTAIHLACQSLRTGESDFVLAGGVSLMLTPEVMVAMSKVGIMAPDGRCKTFDARADGMGRGEGCGVVALKRLSDALADRDRVHAVIRGSATNQDGRSTVLTAPNGLAQEALVREALGNAAVSADRIVYIETHGTGTALGDPIEVGALAAALGSDDAPPCFMGSAKANIGHLEAAAGVIGLIKSALVLREGEIPPQPGFGEPNPHLELGHTRLKIAKAAMQLPDNTVPCAAVSSFGMGGSNAHIVLERAPELPEPPHIGADAVWTLPLSAKTADGLGALGKEWLDLLEAPAAPPIGDLCYTASQRRSHYPVRLAVTGRTHSELRSRLTTALTRIAASPDVDPPRIGFVYSGQGPQWWAMGRELRQHEPAFAASLEQCDLAIKATAGWSVLEELSRDEQSTRLGETEIAQPALFAIQTALTALWRSWGVAPEAVTGHSVGEIAAFHAAGALSLEEAARVVVLRGRAMQAATGKGRMAAAAITESDARLLTRAYEGQLDIAAVNAPASVVLSGEPSAVEDALARLAKRGVQGRALPVDYAFHSAQMSPLAQRFERDLGTLDWRAPDMTIVSTLTGAPTPQRGFTAADVASAIRSPVRFADAIKTMAAAGIDTFVEIGPHPVLAAAIAETLDPHPPRLMASLRRGRDERETMREACAQLYAAGHDPDWSSVQPGEGVVTTLPSYPWRRKRHWLRQTARTHAGIKADAWLGVPMPLVGKRATAVRLDPAAIKDWLADHHIFGRAVVPGAAMMHAMASVARTALGRDVSLTEFEIAMPLPAPDDPENTCWQILVDEESSPRVSLQEGTRPEKHAPFSWRVIAEAQVGAARRTEAWSPVVGTPLDLSAAYARVEKLGAALGPTFRVLSDVVAGEEEGAGWAEKPAGLAVEGVHPALIDAGFQLANLVLGESNSSYVPIAVDAIELGALSPQRVRVKARLVARSTDAIIADIVLETEDGLVVAALSGVRLAHAKADAFRVSDAAESYVVDWTPAPPAAAGAKSRRIWAVVGSTLARQSGLIDAALARGMEAKEIAAPSEASGDATIVMFSDAVSEAADLAALMNSISSGARLTLVTNGAVTARENEAADGHGASLWGLASVAALERPELGLRVIDLDPGLRSQGKDVLAALEAGSAPHLALRDGSLLVPRLRRLPMNRGGKAQRVTLTGEGLQGVRWAAFTPPAPGPGEVLIKVAAAGVNFRDVLMAIGMYPGAPVGLGGECAGTVEAVGSGVKNFEIGARVFGFAPASHATHALARADMIAPTPDALSDVAATTVPSAYLTADIGLCMLARMRAGDRVLIHAATGGVGLAAVALAQRIGAEIHATAGSPEKRAQLKQMGVAHVYDSRSLDYADQILEATRGEGVRIALNSLTGAFVGATLRALARGGVLLELGKREIWSPEQVSALRPDVEYHVYDTGSMLEVNPGLFAEFAQDLVPQIGAGDLPVIQSSVWPMARAAEAYRWMAQARHVGKIVLVPADEAPQIREDATYLITGGFGGLGLLSAEWLAEHGARRLLLVGRTAPGAAAQAKIAALTALGVYVRVAVGDVADAQTISSLLAQAAAEGAPVRGVIHAAGVAPDRTLANLTAKEFAQARRGKVEGAYVLQAATKNQELDFVVLYSSASVVLGSPGQGAYASANAEMDACATAWRRDGVRALSVAWGPWADAGMFAASQTQTQTELASRGLTPLSALRAFSALEQLMSRDIAYGVVADIDWKRFLARAPSGLDLSMFAAFSQSEPAPTSEDNAITQLTALPITLRRAALETLVRDRVRTVIGLSPDHDLPLDAPLKEAGLDSLMAVELRNGLARLGGMPLPAALAFDYPNIDALAAKLAAVWGLETASPKQEEFPADSDLEALSEADAEAELEDELRSLAASRRGDRRSP
jgi:acyl transferase domain-containing protein